MRMRMRILTLFSFLISLPSILVAESWTVPQIGATDFRPGHIEFYANDPNLILVLNTNGRIDILNIRNPLQPEKQGEILAGAISAVFSPGERSLVTGGADGTLRLWDLRGNQIGEFGGLEGPLNDVAFSPDGTRILSGGNELRLWDLQGNQLAVFDGFEGPVNSVAFSPDSTQILSGGSELGIWDLQGNQITVFDGLKGPVNSVAFSPDGTQILSVSDCLSNYCSELRLWDLQGNQIAKFDGLEEPVESVAFSPDGSRILTGGGVAIRLWDLQGNQIAKFDGIEETVDSVAFSPDGTQILSGSASLFVGRSGLRFWELQGNQIAEFDGLKGPVRSVAFSPDGTRILSAGVNSSSPGIFRSELQLWDLRGNQITEFNGIEELVYSVAFSPDGTRILFGGSELQLWDLQGNQVAVFDGFEGPASSVVFSPDGTRILSSGSSSSSVNVFDDELRLWDLQGNQLAVFDAIEGEVNSIAFSPDGNRILSGGGALQLWDLQGNKLTVFEGLEKPVNSVAFSPDGTRVLSGGGRYTSSSGDLFSNDTYGGELQLWDLQGNQIAEFAGIEGSVNSVAFSPDGTRILSGSGSLFGSNGELHLWDLQGRQIAEFDGLEGLVHSVAFSSDGTQILSGGGVINAINGDVGELHLWDLQGSQIAEFDGIEEPRRNVAFSPDGTRILSSGSALQLWDLQGNQLAVFTTNEVSANSVAFSPDGARILSGGGSPALGPFKSSGELQLWDLQGNQIEKFEVSDKPVKSVVFSPNGSQILSGGSGLLLWNLQGNRIAEFKEVRGWVSSVAFSPDGTRILSGGGFLTSDDGYIGALQLWDLQGNQIVEFDGLKYYVNSVAFSPDGTRVLSGGGSELRLWDLQGNQIVEFDGLKESVDSVAFSPDGTLVLSGGGSELRLWDLQGNGIAARPVCQLQSSMFLSRDGEDPGRIVALCADRVVYFDHDLSLLGQVFLIPGDGMSWIRGEGVSAYNGAPYRLFSTFEEFESTSVSDKIAETYGRPLAADVTEDRLRQVLLNDWIWVEKVNALAVDWRNWATELYNTYVKGWTVVPFVGAVALLFVWILSLLTWLLIPAQMYHWMLPSPNALETPPLPKQVLNMVLVFRWLARTRRPRGAWFRKYRDALEAACFTNRTSVKERERYADVALENRWSDPAPQIRGRERFIAWVHGDGGTGKTAFACNFAHRHFVGHRKAPMPIFIDEDWTGELAEHVSSAMRLPEWKRGLTAKLARKFGEDGFICPIVDSLSERSGETLEAVTRSLNESNFRHGIITSREPPPSGAFWEDKFIAQTRALSPPDVQKFIMKYVNDGAKYDLVQRRIAPMTTTPPLPKPLFLRFAIVQAEKGELASAERTALVLRYVEAARKDDISKEDFARAARVAATAAMHGQTHGPKELNFEYLRGIFQSEANSQPFMTEAGNEKIAPIKLIGYLVSSGVLSRNRVNSRLQFNHDPVAEYLAAWEVAENSGSDAQVRSRLIEPFRDSLIPTLFPEIEAYKKSLILKGSA